MTNDLAASVRLKIDRLQELQDIMATFASFLTMLLAILTLDLVEPLKFRSDSRLHTELNPRTLSYRRSAGTECSAQELESILQACKESMQPGDTSVVERFCGSCCKSRVVAYANACNHTSVSLNVTGTCLFDGNQPQCIFGVLLIRPGISSCKAFAITTNNELSTATSTCPSLCSLYATYNTTGDYYQIQFDVVSMTPVIVPPLKPPWDNCSNYYEQFGQPPQLNDRKRTVPDEVECSQPQLEDIIRKCEETVMPKNDSNISERFCVDCRSRVVAYASVCNMTDFSLNVTGSCQLDSTDIQCIFAVIIIRPGISSCSAIALNSSDIATTLQTDTPACCSLQSMVNTTGEFYTIQPDPQTGLLTVNPPLEPPWESCGMYTSSVDYSCDAGTTTPHNTPTTTLFVDNRTTIASTTEHSITPTSHSVSLHALQHLYLISLIIFSFHFQLFL